MLYFQKGTPKVGWIPSVQQSWKCSEGFPKKKESSNTLQSSASTNHMIVGGGGGLGGRVVFQFVKTQFNTWSDLWLQFATLRGLSGWVSRTGGDRHVLCRLEHSPEPGSQTGETGVWAGGSGNSLRTRPGHLVRGFYAIIVDSSICCFTVWFYLVAGPMDKPS